MIKTEAEIRAHKQALETMAIVPCSCRSEGHEEACVEGGRMMKHTAWVLAWVLGENKRMDVIAERMAKDVRKYTESG